MYAATKFLFVAAAFAATAFVPDAAVARVSTAVRTKQSKMTTPAEVGAFGRINATFYPATKTRAARSRLVLTVKRLPARATFSLSVAYRPTIFDATKITLLPDEVKTNRFGRTQVVWDTRDGGSLPLGGTFADHAGRVLRVHDATDKIVLLGKFPAIQ